MIITKLNKLKNVKIQSTNTNTFSSSTAIIATIFIFLYQANASIIIYIYTLVIIIFIFQIYQDTFNIIVATTVSACVKASLVATNANAFFTYRFPIFASVYICTKYYTNIIVNFDAFVKRILIRQVQFDTDTI